MRDQEKRQPAGKAVPSLLRLALQVLRGEMSEAEAIEIVRQANRATDEEGHSPDT